MGIKQSSMENMGLINNNFWEGKKVLITGHNGFKGSWLTIWLLILKAEVYGFSLEPEELRSLCHDTLCAWESIQGIKYGSETNLFKKGIFTRQYWSLTDIKAGSKITTENVKSIRAPANEDGMSPKHFRNLFGKRAKRDIIKHAPVRSIDIEK